MDVRDLKVYITWRPTCDHPSSEEAPMRVEIVPNSSQGTATGVRFQVDAHIHVCPVCGEPYRMHL